MIKNKYIPEENLINLEPVYFASLEKPLTKNIINKDNNKRIPE